MKLLEKTIFAVVGIFFLVACSPDTEQQSKVGLPNPASVYCADQGGASVVEQTSGGSVGYCHLPDGSVVAEWEYFRASQKMASTSAATPAA